MPQILKSLLPLVGLLVVIAILVSILKAIFVRKMAGSLTYPYQAIPQLFTPAERSFLSVLDQAIDSEYRIFGKVRVADVMSVTKGTSRSDWQKAFNRIQSKHFDFVVCRASDSSILVLIELDDRSHLKNDRVERDDLVNKAAEAAGLPLLRIPCRKSYSAHDLSELLAKHLPTSNHTNKAFGGHVSS